MCINRQLADFHYFAKAAAKRYRPLVAAVSLPVSRKSGLMSSTSHWGGCKTHSGDTATPLI